MEETSTTATVAAVMTENQDEQGPRRPDLANKCDWGKGDVDSTDIMQVISLVLCFVGAVFKVKALPWASLIFSLAGISRSPYAKMENVWFMPIMIIVPITGLFLEYFGPDKYI